MSAPVSLCLCWALCVSLALSLALSLCFSVLSRSLSSSDSPHSPLWRAAQNLQEVGYATAMFVRINLPPLVSLPPLSARWC